MPFDPVSYAMGASSSGGGGGGGGGGVLVVHGTWNGDVETLDKGAAEIETARAAGTLVIKISEDDNGIAYLSSSVNQSGSGGGAHEATFFSVYPDGSVDAVTYTAESGIEPLSHDFS